MNIYLLSQAFGRFNVLDEFETFIWTERYSDGGDFEITIAPTLRMRQVLIPGVYVTHTESSRLGVVDEVLVQENEAGAVTMTVTGRLMEDVLKTRVITTHNVDGNRTTSMTGSTGEIVADMVSKICVHGLGVAGEDDIIPELYVANTSGTTEVFTIGVKTQSLYTAVKELCDSENLGFRVQLLATSPRLRFNIFKGVVRPNVVFSSALDNLAQESYLKSHKSYRNMAYVIGKDDGRVEIVPAPGVSIYAAGFKRRAIVVDGSDIDPAVSGTWDEYRGLLKRRGLEALASTQRLTLFDGELTNDNPYIYGTHYALGDIVTQIDEYNIKSQVVVSEHIWTHDQQGLRSYPTFTAIEAAVT